MTEPRPETLFAIFLRFLRFGLLAWGGPVAQIAMLKRELVDEQKWVSPTRFNRLLAIFQVLPGPEAHELCVHFGMIKRGRAGGVVAGLGFMLPGLVLILALAWAYSRFDLSQGAWASLFLGVQVGVIALIVRAAHRIGQHTLINPWLAGIALASAAAALLDVSFWIALPAAGAAYVLLARGRLLLAAFVMCAALAIALLNAAGSSPAPGSSDAAAVEATSRAVGALPLFLSGLKAGLLTFGGAYTAIPFVRDDAVGRGWLSDAQFLDGLALSGIIPAPLIIFATFVGYQAGGFDGALAITAGIFLPAFAFSLLFFERLERVVEDQRLHRFLEGVAAAVVGLIAATLLELATSVGSAVPSLLFATLIFAASLTVLYAWKSKLNVVAVIALSAAAGAVGFG